MLDLLQLVGSFSILVAAVSYCAGADERKQSHADARKARQYQAWQVITNAQGKPGNGGRIQALEELSRDTVDLAGIDVSSAYLRRVRLPFTFMNRIVADSADLTDSRLQGSVLNEASFRHARLSHADLGLATASRTDFSFADFTGTKASRTRFVGARFICSWIDSGDFTSSNLTYADFRFANIGNVKFDSANLSGADFRGALLENVDLSRAHFAGANFYGAEFYSVRYGFSVDTPPRRFRITPDAEREIRRRGGIFVKNDTAFFGSAHRRIGRANLGVVTYDSLARESVCRTESRS